jgi:NAD(P)-dependent dehydrogenase (short-subunit alcohol dehydrogenase family)
MGSLDGRVALITGAGHGLGREHALLFAEEGAKVVVNDLDVNLDGSPLEASAAQQVVDEIVAAGGEAVADHGDVADYESARQMVAQAIDSFGRLDVLVNNAGFVLDSYLHKMTEQQFDEVIRVHLKGHFAPLRHATDHWRKRSKSGEEVNAALINTMSGSGTYMPNPGQLNYGAAKAGIAAMTLVAALELGRIGVRANAIAPVARTRATLATPGPIGEMMQPPEDPDALDTYHPAYVSALVAYLATADCPITGKAFEVHGGAITELTGWTLGTPLESDGGWTVDRVADALGIGVAR